MKHSGTEYLCEAQCKCGQNRLVPINGRIVEVCPHEPPVYVNSDGTKEKINIIQLEGILPTDLTK
jgi:hypothetical protein